MIKIEVLIFLFLISILISYLLSLNFFQYFLIIFFITYIFLSLYRKNRHIGFPALAAVFTVLVTLYSFGLVGNCHLCTTHKDGVIFFCNNMRDMIPMLSDKQLGDEQCVRELIWVWPPKK